MLKQHQQKKNLQFNFLSIYFLQKKSLISKKKALKSKLQNKLELLFIPTRSHSLFFPPLKKNVALFVENFLYFPIFRFYFIFYILILSAVTIDPYFPMSFIYILKYI